MKTAVMTGVAGGIGFATAKKLTALCRKRLVKAGQSKTGTVDIRNSEFPHQTAPSADTAQIQRVMSF